MENATKIKKPMTKEEVMLFINLVDNYPTITSKETNAVTNKLKEEAWCKLTNNFNSKCGSIPRTKEQLKLKWDNLKKAARKRSQNIRLNMMKTGGGKSEYIPPDDILEKVSGMMGSTCTGFAVPFGGDAEEAFDISNTGFDTTIENTEDGCMEPFTSVDDALPQMPENDLLPEQNSAKKRKLNFSSPGSKVSAESTGKFLYGMPIMSKSLQNKGRNKNNGDGRLQKNLAIANYFNKMTEKLELEIILLKKEIENKNNNN